MNQRETDVFIINEITREIKSNMQPLGGSSCGCVAVIGMRRLTGGALGTPAGVHDMRVSRSFGGYIWNHEMPDGGLFPVSSWAKILSHF